MSSNNKKEEICNLIDVLMLDMLDLIEQQVQCKVNIEKRTNEGKLLLAKSRYAQGQQAVGIAQLPTENSSDFNALLKVTETEGADDFHGKQLMMDKHDIDKNSGFIDPIKWFGILVPRSLQFARERFEKSLELVLECANIQKKLNSTICYLYKLRNIKNTV